MLQLWHLRQHGSW